MTCRRLYPAVVLVVVTASIVLAGCTTARNALGPAESPCFQALPVAHAAVNDTGHFSGVRYLTATQLTSALETVKKYTRRASRDTGRPLAPDKRRLCRRLLRALQIEPGSERLGPGEDDRELRHRRRPGAEDRGVDHHRDEAPTAAAHQAVPLDRLIQARARRPP